MIQYINSHTDPHHNSHINVHIDSNINSGVQVYKPPPDTFKEIKENSSKEIKIQKSLKKLIEESGIDIALEHTVWQVNYGFKIYAFNLTINFMFFLIKNLTQKKIKKIKNYNSVILRKKLKEDDFFI